MTGHNPNALTVADIEDVETVLGIDFADVNDALRESSTGGRLRILAALVWVHRRRHEPGYTFDQARNLPPDELTALMSALADDLTGPPTFPAPSAPESPSPAYGDARLSPSVT